MAINSFVPESPYLLRYLAFALATGAKQSVFDHRYFSGIKMCGCKDKYLQKEINRGIGENLVEVKGESVTLDKLLANSDTLTFMVVKDGKVVYDYYADGVTPETPLLAYSVTKSFFSTYLAHLIDNNLFTLSDELRKYNAKLPPFVGVRTVQSLMNMESGIRYSHGRTPEKDMVRFWFTPNIRKSLSCIHPLKEMETRFLYNDIHLHLLYKLADTIVSDVPTDFKQLLWKSIGMSHDGFFTVDSSSNKWLKVDGGLAVTAHDLAKFGLLYLNDGFANGRQIISPEWCQNVKSSEGVRRDLEYYDLYRQMNHRWYPIFKQGRTYYKNFWWGIEQENQKLNDIFAMGILGQLVYVSSENGVVIVRQGKSWGIEGWWPSIFEKLVQKI